MFCVKSFPPPQASVYLAPVTQNYHLSANFLANTHTAAQLTDQLTLTGNRAPSVSQQYLACIR